MNFYFHIGQAYGGSKVEKKKNFPDCFGGGLRPNFAQHGGLSMMPYKIIQFMGLFTNVYKCLQRKTKDWATKIIKDVSEFNITMTMNKIQNTSSSAWKKKLKHKHT